MAGCEVARRQRHGHGGQQRRQHRHQAQEARRAIQRLAHLGAARFERFQPHATQLRSLDQLLGLRDETLHGIGRGIGAGHQGHAVGDSAGRLHEAGGGEVAFRQQQAGGEVHEAGAPVGLGFDQGGQAQRAVAQQEGVAELESQAFGHSGVHPNFAGRRRRRPARQRLPQCDAPAQRVAAADGLDRHEPALAALRLGGPRHARKGRRADDGELQCLGQLDEGRGCRLVAGDDGIAAQQLARVAAQAAVQPVRQESHCAQRRHGQRHGQHQQAQLTGSPVPQQLPPGDGQGGGRTRGGHGVRRHARDCSRACSQVTSVSYGDAPAQGL